MHLRYSLIAILLSVLVCSAGCLGSDRAPAPVPATSSYDLGRLALGAGDVPDTFTLTVSREKNATEVSSLALDLGWQDGYTVQFNGTDTTVLSQSIARYPPERMKDILQYVVGTEESAYPGSVINLTDPKIGETSFAYAVVRTTGWNATTSLQDVPPQEIAYYEILFSKGPVFEVIRMGGPSANSTILSGLAVKAANKI